MRTSALIAAILWSTTAFADYPSTILADTPAAYFHLGEATCSGLTDSSGNGKHGACVSATMGATGAIAGYANNAISFNGTSDFANLCGTPPAAGGCADAYTNPASTNAYTVEAWVNLDTLPSTAGHNMAIVSKLDLKFGDPSVGGWHLYVESSSGNKLAYILFDSGRNFAYGSGVSTTAFTTGQWYHVVGTSNLYTSIKIYMNGVDVTGTTAHPGTFAQTNSGVPISIGRDHAADNTPTHAYLDGSIDEVALYNTALSGATIANHYTAGTSAPSVARRRIISSRLELPRFRDNDYFERVAVLGYNTGLLAPNVREPQLLRAAFAAPFSVMPNGRGKGSRPQLWHDTPFSERAKQLGLR